MQFRHSETATRRPRAHRRRDRRGRGMRGVLAPAQLPVSRSRGERFDDLVLDAVEELGAHLAEELSGVEFAVEDVPGDDVAEQLSSEVFTDRGVALGQLHRQGLPDSAATPTVVVFRRPIEARAIDVEDAAELVFMVVAELVADLLGRDIDEIDPP